MTDRWVHTVEALNTATDSTNKIHDDAVAASFGFRGGLVPGVDVWAYLSHPPVERWGLDFLTSGSMEARFATPVYDGDRVTASMEADGSLAVVDSSGATCATGRAWMRDQPVDVPDIPYLDRLDVSDRPPAGAETLTAGTVLGTVEFTFDPTKSARYLDEVRETHDLYADTGIAHPGWLARLCNTVLWASVELGPWIHVGTSAEHLGVAQAGDAVEVRGRVIDEREHRGHRFVDLDVVITAATRPIFVALHTAIWRPRQVAEAG